MPPSQPHPGGHLRRVFIVIGLLAALALGAYGFTRIGPVLTREDPLEHVDAILVLAGTKMVRPLEAGDLYLAGYAPVIVMTRDLEESDAFAAINRRGLPVPRDADRAREVLVSMGIPRSAIVIPDRLHDSTAAEAQTYRELVERNHWRTVIVVTSRFHLGRARFAIERALRGTNVRVVMRSSRYDPMRPERWWTRRAEIRWVGSELTKFLAYRLGLGA